MGMLLDLFRNKWPYTDFHELNADWIISTVRQLIETMDSFIQNESISFADPITWNITTQYAKATVVIDSAGNAYLSKQAVPAGIQLNNSEYWQEIFNFTNYTRTANRNLTFNVETDTTRATAAYNVDDWLILNDVLYRVTQAIAIDDTFIIAPASGSNIVHFTVEDFIKAWITTATALINQYKDDIDASELAYRQELAQDIALTTASLQAQLNAAIAGATVDSEVINARVGINSYTYATLHDAIVGQIGDTRIIDLLRNPIPRYLYSINKNYAFSSDFTLVDSTLNYNGAIGSNAGYTAGYIMIPFPGTFTTYRRSGNFGSHQADIPLYDQNKQFVKTLTGTVLSASVVEFTITEEDYKTCVYAGLTQAPSRNMPMWYHDTTYPSDFVYHEPELSLTSSALLPYNGIKPTTIDELMANSISKLENNHVVAGSANIFTYDDYTWEDGYILPLTGEINTNTAFEYALIPICGNGNYTNFTDLGSFGSNSVYVPLYDINKNYIGYVTGTVDAQNNRKLDYTINNSAAQYIGLSRSKTGVANKVYFNRQDYIDANGNSASVNSNWITSSDPFYKTEMCFIGDSVCNGSSDLPYNRGGYPGRFNLEYQAPAYNYGENGATITAETYYSNSNPRHWITRDVETVHSDHPNAKYILLEGGTNDADVLGRWSGNTPPARWGSYTDDDFSGSYDDTTFCGAVEQLLHDIITLYPDAKIAFLIPMQMGYANVRTIENRRKYFDGIVDICKKWHVFVIDAWDNIGVDARLTSFYDPSMTNDENVAAKHFYVGGQHPSSYGYNRLYDFIKNQLYNL